MGYLKRIIRLLIILLICNSTSIDAQIIMAKDVKEGVLTVPDVFNSYVKASLIDSINEGNITVEELKHSSTTHAWAVYSDRDDNNTFFEPGSAEEVQDTLSFQDTLYVKSVENNWINVVKLKARGKKFVISKDMGWIKADKLLLCKYATLSSKGAPLKRMILVTASDFDRTKNIEELLENKNYFTNPESDRFSNLLEKYESGLMAKKFEILFVLKQTDHAVLLSSSDKITNISVKGWINKLKTTPWTHRVALEPASGSIVKDRFYDKNTKEYDYIPVFLEPWHLEKYFDNAANVKSEWVLAQIPLSPKRLEGYQMRFPVLDWKASDLGRGNNDKQKHLAVIAEFGAPEGTGVYDEDRERAKLRRRLDSINDLRDFVNVLIIMDGTSSMANYGPQISKSIETIIQQNKITGNKKMRWGLAVYRDYLDGDVFIERLSGTPERVLNKLKSGNIDYYSKNKSHATAQYDAMNTALDNAGFKEGESNIVVLVGDAGNHKVDKDGLTKHSVIEKLFKHRINLISFQVNYLSGENGPIYKKFNRDARSYMLLSGDKIIQEMTSRRAGRYGVKLVPEKNNSYSLGFTGFNSEKVKPVFGIFNHAVKGTGMKESVFYRNLIQSFNKYMKQLDLEHRDLCVQLGDCIDTAPKKCGDCNRLNKNCICDDDEKKRKFKLTLEDFCARHNLSQRECDLLYKEGDVAVAGYSPVRLSNTDALVPVAFISKSYKKKIDERLGDLQAISSKNITKARDQLYSTIITLVRGLMGPNTPEETIMNKSFNDIWDILLGVPFSENSPLRNKKIKDLRSSNIGSDDLLEFIELFQSDCDKFMAFPEKKDKRFSSWRNGDQTFYWIPFSRIPRGGE